MRAKFPAIALLFSAAASSAETRWIHMRSPNFEMYSSASEGGARDTLRYFEQVRSFFLQTTQRTPAHPLPVYIVAFGSEKEYAPYRFNEVASAYYHPGAERDYIVLSRAGAETFPTATHEYVHLVIEHAGLKFPPWLNEGLAELYSTLRPLGDKVIVGTLIPGRVQALNAEKWVPLSVILGAGRDSPYYNEKNKAGSLYNEGWALVHMLSLSAEYRPRFAALLAAIHDGTPSPAALEKTYGKPLAAIEKDLQNYLRGDRFNAATFPARLEKEKGPLPSEPAAEFDLKFALADLTNVPGKRAQARERFEELVRDDPKRPEPWSALGYLAWQAKQYPEAVDDFAKAFELGARGSRMLWDYGRLAQRGRSQDALLALTELVALEPDRADARIELASAQLAAKQPVQAIRTLNEIKKVDAADAPRVFAVFAYAEIDLGMRDEARAAISRLTQYAKTPEDRDRAERLTSYLDSLSKNTANAPPSTAELLNSDEPPRLERRARPGVEEEAPPAPSVTGAFVELRCLGDQAVVAVETAEGSKTFLIQDPAEIAVIGREGGKVDLQCGAQNRTPIKVEYAAGSSNAKTDGVVRAIYFDPP